MKSSKTAARAPLTRIIVIGLCALLAGLLAALWMHKPAGQSLKSGTLLTQPRPLPDFTLTDQDGGSFTPVRLHGHWTLIFPGFTSCPDVCPTTLAVLRKVQDQLGADAARLQVAMLTIDPERDVPEKMKAYVHTFSQDFIGLSTPEPQLKELARALGVAYVKVPGSSADTYTMDHSSALILINPQGRLAGFLTPPFDAATLVADLQPLLRTEY